MSKRKSESESFGPSRPAGIGLVAAAAAAVVGCAPVTTLDGERLPVRSDEFAAYVEDVFREQNRVASALAFALEDATDPARIDALETAEDALFAACDGLNALAAARRDGERTGPFRSLEAARRAPECERAAADARRILDRDREGDRAQAAEAGGSGAGAPTP
ncbi:MAG TPA: hypothetical protein VF339_06375 [Gammaproteobacteria bacterium]